MLSYCTNYLAPMPEITVYMNCDTRLAINLRLFGLGENDEFIFAIKNYDYTDSPYALLRRFKASDIDDNGEIIFKIAPEESKKIKPGAFYNFSMLINAFDRKQPTEYKKLTENGSIVIEYGAHDLALPQESQPLAGDIFYVTDVRLADPETVVDKLQSEDSIIGAKLEYRKEKL